MKVSYEVSIIKDKNGFIDGGANNKRNIET